MGVFTRDSAPVPAKALPYSAPRPLIASAQRVRLTSKENVEEVRRRSQVVWQTLAWDYYDVISEIKYAFGLLGNVTSRIRLFPAVITSPAAIPTPFDQVPDDVVTPQIMEDATTLMNRISSARGGQPALLREMTINISVPGECYLVQTPAKEFPESTPEDWSIRSKDEIVVDAAGRVSIKPRSDARPTEYQVIPKDAFVGRIWRSHPRWSDETDSSMRGVLDPCADLLLYTRSMRAGARSRLNAGALYLPDGLSAQAAPAEATLSGTPDPETPPDEDHDEFEEELLLSMTTPIADEESAAAVVPLIIRGPAELGDKIKQFSFERSLDPVVAERADRALERILQGLDVPKDVVTGLANVRYSNAIAIDESLYKAHVEPLALLISDALTAMWLRPGLRELGYPEEAIRKVTVWYDPSDVVMKPDKSDDANDGYDRFLISGQTWRKTHGFTEADKPTEEELAYRMLVDKGQILPETAEMLLTKFAPKVMGTVQAANADEGSGNALPPEVQQALGRPSDVGTPPEEEAGPEEVEPQ